MAGIFSHACLLMACLIIVRFTAGQKEVKSGDQAGKTSDQQVSCPETVKKPANQKKSYIPQTDVKGSFFEAVELCASKDMKLATFTTPLEYNDMVSAMKRDPTPDKSASWTALEDLGEQDRHTWLTTGELLNFTNWAEGEPDHKGAMSNCVEIQSAANYKMFDQPCTEKRYFVCETYGSGVQ